MSQTALESPDIKAQYVAQVASDLERNTQEQQRIGAEMAALKAQLDVLERDHALLVNVRQALGGKDAEAPQPAADAGGKDAGSKDGGSKDGEAANVPAPRRNSAPSKPARRKKAETGVAKKAETGSTKKPEAGNARKAERGSAKKPEAKAAGSTAKPTLIALVRQHLSGHTEPRSAAEITASLSTSHPDRGIKATVVRTTVESLVAKGLAHRSKQGSSVFYASTQDMPDESSEKTEPAGA